MRLGVPGRRRPRVAHPHIGGPFERGSLVKRYKKARKAAGVRPVRFHDLRHTFGTRMAAAGVPMRTLQEWLGHRDCKTTSIYAPGEHEAALVAAAFGEAAGTDPGTELSETQAH